MLIQERLCEIYQRRGHRVQTGAACFNFRHSGDREFDFFKQFTSIYKDGARVATGWGMSFAELSLFEFLSEIYQPASLFGIGNAFGWSTVALRLFFPGAALACIDAGIEGNDNMAGIDLTNEILGEAGGGSVIYGFSPADVPRVVEEKLGGHIDLAFIDGNHTNAQLILDYEAVRPYLTTDHLVICHDVEATHLHEGFGRISEQYQGRSAILSRTDSGIGVLYSPVLAWRMSRVIALFSDQ
jgi:predicted O-methyltransferase YrrM